MPEDVHRLLGKDAQRNNIFVARMVAEIVKTTLGPRGMDKMLVSPTGDIVITNDGVTILEEMQIEHPAAKMMVEIARTQESEVGDGTTTAVMIAGKLLENAEKLLDKKIHPTTITKGYRLASEKSQEILKDISLRVTPNDIDVLKQIAMTAMTGKGAEDAKEKFAEIIVQALRQIEDNGKIELIDFPLELKNPEIDTKISITSPEQLQGFVMQEEREIKEMVEKVKISGANVIFCQKGIDDFAQYLLAKEGTYACRRVARSDMEKISKATGAKIVSNINELTPFETGNAQTVEEIKHGTDSMTYITGCQNPKALTILIHGGTEHVIDEVERSIKDGLGDVSCVLQSELVVPGGGAVEIELAP